MTPDQVKQATELLAKRDSLQAQFVRLGQVLRSDANLMVSVTPVGNTLTSTTFFETDAEVSGLDELLSDVIKARIDNVERDLKELGVNLNADR
jgi:hypothetical protein